MYEAGRYRAGTPVSPPGRSMCSCAVLTAAPIRPRGVINGDTNYTRLWYVLTLCLGRGRLRARQTSRGAWHGEGEGWCLARDENDARLSDRARPQQPTAHGLHAACRRGPLRLPLGIGSQASSVQSDRHEPVGDGAAPRAERAQADRAALAVRRVHVCAPRSLALPRPCLRAGLPPLPTQASRHVDGHGGLPAAEDKEAGAGQLPADGVHCGVARGHPAAAAGAPRASRSTATCRQRACRCCQPPARSRRTTGP